MEHALFKARVPAMCGNAEADLCIMRADGARDLPHQAAREVIHLPYVVEHAVEDGREPKAYGDGECMLAVRAPDLPQVCKGAHFLTENTDEVFD